MDDPTSPDRVPLDRPPVPRFSPLPDLPDLPELPRGSAIAPTPSIPIPAPPLPAPRVMVDLPRPSPTVSIDPPKPRPLPTPPPKPTVAPPVPTPVIASTPAPKGRWVGEALASLVTPTKSKVTVLAAAGSLVAGAFALQLLVGSGGDTATTKPKTPEVAAVTKGAELESKLVAPGEHSDPKPPSDDDAPSSVKGKQFYVAGIGVERLGEWADLSEARTTTAGGNAPAVGGARTNGAADLNPPGVTIRLPAMPTFTNREVIPASGETPTTPVTTPGSGVPDLNLPTLPVAPGGTPLIPAPVPTSAAPIPVPAPLVPTPVTAPVAPPPVRVTLPAPPVEAGKSSAPPMLPTKPIDAPKSIESTVQPTQVESNRTPVPPGLGFKFDPDPLAPTQPLPVTPAPVPLAPTPVPPFGIVEPPPQPKALALPTPPASDVRTDYDVDLHPAQVGQTYEAVSKQHYADAKYADALRSYNKGRDPGRDEVQIPPVYVLRKLAGTRTPAAGNPVAPASGEAWVRPATFEGAKPVAAGRSYTVPQDETTFRDLAGTLLSDRKLYRRISDLNPTIDANAKLQKGDKITVP